MGPFKQCNKEILLTREEPTVHRMSQAISKGHWQESLDVRQGGFDPLHEGRCTQHPLTKIGGLLQRQDNRVEVGVQLRAQEASMIFECRP